MISNSNNFSFTKQMGNVCKKRSEDDYITTLINTSKSTLDSTLIYHIMMVSGYNAKELLVLYNRFKELDIKARGTISNQEFLDMAELRFSPFRNRLKEAIPMLTDEEILKIKESKPKDDDFIGGPRLDSADGQSDVTAPANRVAQDAGKINSKVLPINDTNEEVPGRISEADSWPYIDFERFAVYLTTFCPRSPIDLKISFAFRMYDLDGDGYISPRDLYDTLNMLVGHTLTN